MFIFLGIIIAAENYCIKILQDTAFSGVLRLLRIYCANYCWIVIVLTQEGIDTLIKK